MQKTVSFRLLPSLRCKGAPGGAYSSIPPAIGMLAPMVAPVRPLPMVQRKPLSYMTYKEGSDPDAHVSYFEKCIWHNRETNEVVIINLFGTTLTDRCRGGMMTGWTTTNIALGMKPKRLSGSGIENKIQMSKYIQLLRPSSKERVRRSKTTMRGS
jgi:hypothetical protein